MSSPAATVPLAVLVLAWDETTPAARALVEATEFAAPAPDSVAVLVLTSTAAEELTQEEFLPLEASLALPQTPAPVEMPAASAAATAADHTGQDAATLATEAAESIIEAVIDLAQHAAGDVLAASLASEESSHAAHVTDAPPLPAAEAATAVALTKPALIWQEIRVLRLGSYAAAAYSASAQTTLVCDGAPAVPAAPYLGSSEPARTIQGTFATSDSAVALALQAAKGSAASAIVALRGLELPSVGPTSTPSELPALGQVPAYLPDELPAAPDAEADATPVVAADEPVLSTNASTTELSEAAADTAETFAVEVSPVQPEAAQPPLAETAEAATETQFFSSAALDMSPGLAALRPAGQPFDAPNLNFQIIQYARQAVPLALAEQPFAVIYAPAWPTWLAAQELRHRSGQPLVLHIAKLAATDDELIDLAAGWVAELQRQALHRADLILTETAALAQRLRHELALPAHRVRAVSAADAAAVAQALRTVQRQ